MDGWITCEKYAGGSWLLIKMTSPIATRLFIVCCCLCCCVTEFVIAQELVENRKRTKHNYS
jgi:hypothetical protein